MTPPVRVVVLVSPAGAAAWERRVLDALRERQDVEVVGVRAGRRAPSGPRLGAARRVERRLFGVAPDALRRDPVALREPARDTGDALLVHLEGAPAAGGDALWLVHGRPGLSLEAACEGAMRTGQEGVRTEVWVRRRGRERVVAATISGVRPYALTVAPNQIRWKLAGTVARALAHLDGPAPARPEPPPVAPAGPARGLWLPARWARAGWIRFAHRRPWRLRVRATGPVLQGGWARGAPVSQAAGHLYADPFLFERDGRVHLFCEEVTRGGRLGVISHLELGAGAGAPQPVLRAAHHLSYPFLLEHGGEVLMVPESAGAGRVELFRATAFPTGWELDCVLLDGVALADATLLEHEGRWWLFGTVAEPGASLLDELHLHSAPDLRGPWTAHPANPVVSDARVARPAGPFLRRGGRLVRPAQDGSRRYGGALVLQEVLELTPERYAERTLERLEPAALPGARAVHHYCRAGGYEAVDVRIRERRWGARRAG